MGLTYTLNTPKICHFKVKKKIELTYTLKNMVLEVKVCMLHKEVYDKQKDTEDFLL